MTASKLELLFDEIKIKNAVVQERYYRDNGMWEELRQSYHPDSSKTAINITWYRGDADGFVEGSKKMAAGGSRAVHTITPVIVRIEGGKALTESNGSILLRFTHDGIQYDLTSYARFVSRLERVDDDWKLLSLEVLYERDKIVPVFPIAASKTLTIPENSRESYKGLAWVLGQAGFTVDVNLPGSDLPGSSDATIREAITWLEA